MTASFGPLELKTKYGKYNVTFHVGNYHYDHSQPALTAQDAETGEPIMTCSVMMDGAEIEPDHIFIKAWSENEGVDVTLQQMGLIEAPTRSIAAGYASAGMHKMKGALLDAWHKHKEHMKDLVNEAD